MRKARAAIAAFFVFFVGIELGWRLRNYTVQQDNYVIPRTHPAAESARRRLQVVQNGRENARNN